MTTRKRGRGADPGQTRQALVDAAFETVQQDGFRGATARAIADRAGCNQATIYYHFGGITPLLIEALRVSSERRLARYHEALDGLTDPRALLAELDALHDDDVASGHLTVMVELLSGITAEPALREGLVQTISAWLAFVADRVNAALGATPFAGMVPVDDLVDLIFSLSIGIELRTKLDGDTTRFTRVVNVGRLIAAVTTTATPVPSTD